MQDGTFFITPILDAGHRTGKSLLFFQETFGKSSSPDIPGLGGTVFAIAIPVGNGGSSSTNIVLPADFASNGTTNDSSASLQIPSLSSRSSFSLSLQESQTGLVLTGLANHSPSAGEGEDIDDQILNWLINGELWRERHQLELGEPPPSSQASQRWRNDYAQRSAAERRGTLARTLTLRGKPTTKPDAKAPSISQMVTIW